MGQTDAGTAAPDPSKLREELLSAVASIFDRAVEAAWRQGAEAAARAALASVTGAAPFTPGNVAGGNAPPTPRQASNPPPSAPVQQGFLPPPVPARASRAASGAVQDGVVAVLERSPKPLAPLDIVAAGREMGLNLKPSSVRMALQKLGERGRVGGDVRRGFRLEPGGEVAQSDAPGSATSDT